MTFPAQQEWPKKIDRSIITNLTHEFDQRLASGFFSTTLDESKSAGFVLSGSNDKTRRKMNIYNKIKK
jgi:hypothetical protein